MTRGEAIARGVVGLAKKRWRVTRYRKPLRIHVHPVKDLREHVFTGRCWCNPTVERQGNARLITHNAEDGRDLVERYGLQ
jgi:hypothetical protein